MAKDLGKIAYNDSETKERYGNALIDYMNEVNKTASEITGHVFRNRDDMIGYYSKFISCVKK